MKIAFELTGSQRSFYGVGRGGLMDWTPPLTTPKKRGGYPPIPPLLGWVERARDRGQRWVYREPGKARCIFTAKAHCLIGSLGCSCLVPVLTPANFLMASCLKIENNEARCYCSVHQGANIARGTLERVVHPYPQRHAHTWPRAPCHCIWLLCRVFMLVQSQPTNVHSFLTKRERGGPHPVLDSAECYHHSGWVCDCHYYGVGKSAPPDSD